MNYEQYVKGHVSEKDWKTLQEMGINMDTKVIADIWPDLVNIRERERTETRFLRGLLPKNPKVFNAATGSATTTIGLIVSGVVKKTDIVSNEIDKEFIRVAKSEAERYGIALNLTSYDWRDIDKYHKTFDAVLCLGNSLTMLLDPCDQKRALKNFRKLLKPNGKLIIDERNYAEHFLKGKYISSGDVVYCGKDKVRTHPVFISKNMVVMEYYHVVEGIKAHLVVFPFERGKLRSLLEQAGFQNITPYGDYMINFNPKDPEFLTYVCEI
ncbi:MAG: class I SAM-dependent methyltransferase [archaeon]|nr:class I SAM-dependent methyltransferase [archaeon]